MKKNEKSQNRLYNIVCIIVIILCALIVSLNLFAIINIVFVNKSNITNRIRALEMGDIISLIGVAVSVWIGGTIINTLDKNKLEKMDKQLSFIEGISNKTVESMKKSIVNKFKLVEDDPISYWIADQIEQIDDLAFLDRKLYDLIENEEECFKLIKKNRGTKKSTYIGRSYTEIVDDIKKWISNNKQDNTDCLKLIIKVRNIQALLEGGYVLKEDYDIKNFMELINIFDEIKGTLKRGQEALYDEEEISEELKQRIVNKTSFGSKEYRRLEMDAHMFYIVGESYSKIVQYRNDSGNIPYRNNKKMDMKIAEKNAKQYEIKAIQIYEMCKKISKDIIDVPEYFYRGYGCTIERCDYYEIAVINYKKNKGVDYKKAINILKSAREQYEKSYKIASANSFIVPNKLNYIFHVITSVNDKIFWLEQSVIPSETDMYTNLDLNKTKINNEEKEKALKYTKNYIKSYPSYPHAYYIRACYMFNLYCCERNEKYYKKFLKYYEHFRTVKSNNTLHNRYENRLEGYNRIMKKYRN